MAAELQGYRRWLPAAAMSALALLAGARLIALSMQQRAAEMRAAAHAVVAGEARQIESALQTLGERARRAVTLAPPALGADQHPRAAAPVTPGANVFWLTPNNGLLQARGADSALTRALASEWRVSGSSEHTASALLGPVRYGAQWFVAAAASGAPAAANTPAGTRAVAYESLDALLMRASFGRLVKEGYDFELSQPGQFAPTPRVLFSSIMGPLTDAVLGAVTTPDVPAPAAATPAYFMLAIRPRTGWYPMRDLATESALLVLLAWALAFGTHELTHSLGRTRRALGLARQRLHAVNERLAVEIEQRQSLQQSLEHARYHDVFTGLPNRRYFMDQLDRALRALRTRRQQRIAILLIDIDRFKLINDTLGHAAGDELMLQAAQRFSGTLGRSECVLARSWGDQLAVLASAVDTVADVHALATRLQDACREPFALRHNRITIATRIGFTCIESGLQRTEDAMREADVALSVAKRHPSALPVAYTPGLGGAAVSLVSLEADLHIALERHEFRLLFQPVVDLRTRRVVGAEALLRWRHPVEGLLAPERFLTIAEEAGLMASVTRWVIQRACRVVAEWQQRLQPDADFFVSVNLSAAALRDPALPDYVARVMSEIRTPPRRLKFELTEGGLISNVTAARELLQAFHAMGIELMLDDFGTGYSSLSYLQLFPFDYVKIDRPCVDRTGSRRADGALTAAIVQMTSSLGLRAVAEVVETQAAAQALAQLGCEFAQGYFFCAPVEAEEAYTRLRDQGSATTVLTARSAAATGEGSAAESGTVTSPTLSLTAELKPAEQADIDTLVLKKECRRGG